MRNRPKIYNKDGKELITLSEAEEMGYGLRNTLQVQILNLRLDGIKIGKTWLVAKDDLE